MTAAAAQTEAPRPAPIRPLVQDGRLSRDGVKNLEPCWLQFRTAGDLEQFLSEPGPWLDGAGDYVQPYTLLHCIDDRCELYVQCLCLMLRLGGSVADVVEIARKALPKALPRVEASGWNVAHNASYGWHCLKDDVVVLKLTNFPHENAARAAMQAEIGNSLNRR
jgi:hypothetical protein